MYELHHNTTVLRNGSYNFKLSWKDQSEKVKSFGVNWAEDSLFSVNIETGLQFPVFLSPWELSDGPPLHTTK